MPVISMCGKGGVTKTASALSIATLYATRGKDVALVDLDPQHSATRALPQQLDLFAQPEAEETAQEGVRDPLTAEPVEIGLAEVKERDGRLSLYRGGRGLIDARRAEIHRRIDGIHADVVIVDTLPVISEITVATMERSDLIVIPLDASADAIGSLPGVLETAAAVAPHARIRLLLTRVDVRERITTDARNLLEQMYPGLLYRTTIPSDVRAKEAASHLRPVVLYAPDCRAARAYGMLLEEIEADLAHIAADGAGVSGGRA